MRQCLSWSPWLAATAEVSASFLAVALILAWGLQPLNDVEPLDVVEKVGTQEYTLSRGDFLTRLEDAYGPEAVKDIEPNLKTFRP